MRETVNAMLPSGISERRACQLIGVARSTKRYQTKKQKNPQLEVHLCKLAERWRRFGYRRLTVMLRCQGQKVNHKKVYRLYCQLNLKLRRRRKNKIKSERRQPMPLPTNTNQRWSIDFVSDSFWDGRRFRTLNIVDDFSRECLGIEISTSIPGARAVRVLDFLVELRGKPQQIVLDNGPEFTSKVFLKWAEERNIELSFIEPGKPIQNAFVESFNGKFRDECLNEHWFLNLEDARKKVEKWRNDYNFVRPHSSLGYLTPEAFKNKNLRAAA